MATKKTSAEVKETKTVTTSPAEPKKSNSTMIIVTILLIVFVGLPILGFGAFWFIVGNKVKNVVEKAEDGKVNLNIGGENINFDASENQKWPETTPSFVPKFTAGKINNAVRIGDNWSVTVTDVTAADFTDYESKLKTAGLAMEESVDMGTVKVITGKKDGYTVSVTFSTDDGKSSVLIGIVKDETETTLE